MDIEVIAIGNAEIIQNIVSDYTFVEKNGIFLISIPKNLYKYTLNQFKSSNIETLEYSQYLQSINASCSNSTISPINSEEAFKWFKSGTDFFSTISGNKFEMHSIDNKNVKVVSSAEPITKCFMSNDGCIYGFIRGHSVSFHSGDDLDLIWDNKLENAPIKIIYSENNNFVGISTSTNTLIYDIFKGLLLGSINSTEFYFVNDSIYYCDTFIDLTKPFEKNEINLKNLKIEPKGISSVVFDKNRKAQFIDGQLQKIVFNPGNGADEIVKNHTNVKKIDFHFSESRLFALIVKNPGKEDHYSVESISNGEITSTTFDSKVIEISVSDNYFAVQLENFKTKFYIKEKHGFKLINSFKKEGPVVIAIKNFVCCLFDTSSNSVEFYDRGELRTTFSHPGCTNIKWSESGLYVATFSYSVNSGCLVQVFDCNGTLMTKKVFNALREFNWRSFPEISEDERKRTLSEHSLDEIEEAVDAETINRQLLLKEWKDYLMSKIIKSD